MKKSFLHCKSICGKVIGGLALGVLAAPAFSLSPVALTGWTVQNGKLMDPNGNPFIFRGVTINHTLAPEKTVQALKDIAALGANSAQIEFPINYVPPYPYPRAAVTQLIEIIRTCAENKLVCVLEPNDVAGFGTSSTPSPSVTVDLWQANDMRVALSAPGVSNHIIIGMGNQHFGSGEALTSFYRDTMQNYTSMLVNSLPPNFLVMIDGSEWSQDPDKSMRQVALGISQDGLLKHRVIYSVDFFSAYMDPEKVRDYIASFAEIGAPLVVGGFGPVPYYHPFHAIPVQQNAPQLPAASVMQYAQQYGAGYFGWSWSGNENPGLDLVSNWDSNNLTSWGNLLFNGVNGIKATAKPASIFNGSSSSASSSSVASNNPPVAVIDNIAVEFVRCGEVYGKASAMRSTDSDGDTLSYKWTVSGPENYTSTNPEIRFSMFWPLVEYRVNLEVSDGKGGVSVSNTAMKHSYSNSCPPPQSSSASSHSKSSSMSSSSIRPSSSSPSSLVSSKSSSSAMAFGKCSYVINSQWSNGFTAAIRIKNTSTSAINGWNVNWQYSDGSKVTNLWNATLSGANPYSAKNLNWNSTIQPGQTVEFGFQGTKSAAAAAVPVVTGAVCQ